MRMFYSAKKTLILTMFSFANLSSVKYFEVEITFKYTVIAI